MAGLLDIVGFYELFVFGVLMSPSQPSPVDAAALPDPLESAVAVDSVVSDESVLSVVSVVSVVD